VSVREKSQTDRDSASNADAPGAWKYAVAWVGAYLWLAVVLTNLPARTALARHQAQFGLEPIAYAITGLAVDTYDFFGVFVLVNLLVALVARLVLRRWLDSFLRALQSTLVATTTILVLGDMLGSVWAAEHKIERGLYPTMFEFANATDAGFALAGAQVFSLSRFSYVTFLSLSLFAVASVFVLRKLRQTPQPTGPKLAGWLVAGTLAATLACFGCHRASPLVIPSIPNWRTIESPLQVFVSFGVERENVRLGSLAMFERLALPAPQLEPGADLLGVPRVSIAGLGQVRDASKCHPHPAADPIAPPPETIEAAGSGYDHGLHRTIDELSRALFEGREGPVRVWLLSLESLRADDIHALHEHAHPDVTPFTNGLYERARAGATDVIVAERMMNAGGRTSQGLSAMTCGMGTMPYGLSSARDLGLLPLRCLPDVLKDASFRTAFYYGSNPGFDNMLSFLNYHGFDRIKAEKDYQEEIPHAGWSVPDWIVFSQAFAESEKEPASQSQFNFAMSLSNHFPFKRPEDFPPEIGERIAKAVEGRGFRTDDISRLETLSYMDWAFGQLVSTIGQADAAKHTFIVAAADHSTTDYFLWRQDGDGEKERADALTHIPFAIVLPDAFIEASADPARVRQLVLRLNQLLSKTALSQNDMPRFILGMLMHSAPMKSLPQDWRWHNLGGQRLSPGFTVPGHPEAVAIGVDGTSQLCVASQDGTFTRLEEKSKLTLDVETAMREGPTLQPAAAVFAALVQGYGKNCWEAKNIRLRP
jgi:Sulfatase